MVLNLYYCPCGPCNGEGPDEVPEEVDDYYDDAYGDIWEAPDLVSNPYTLEDELLNHSSD